MSDAISQSAEMPTLTKPFTVNVQYSIQISEKEAEQLLEMYQEHSDKYAAQVNLAEAFQEAIAWRSCNIVDAIVDDAEEAAEEFLGMMGVED